MHHLILLPIIVTCLIIEISPVLRACEPVVWYGIPVLREANKRIARELVTRSFALLHQIIQKDRKQISHENLNTFRLTFI